MVLVVVCIQFLLLPQSALEGVYGIGYQRRSPCDGMFPVISVEIFKVRFCERPLAKNLARRLDFHFPSFSEMTQHGGFT